MENKNNEGFSFTYSAKEQEEIKKIRNKYILPEEKEDKMDRLRRLDNKVTEKATVNSLIFGILGALIMGFGMSLAMTDIYAFFALGQTFAMVLGIIIGTIGMVLAIFAYPVYNRTLKKERDKIAEEIIRLTDELMK